MFEGSKIYASCHNPRGMISLPVGEVFVKTTEWESCMMLCDVVYGEDLNHLLNRYEDIIEIEFRSPDGNVVLYRAY